MNHEDLITLEQVCSNYEIEFSFIISLYEQGLLKVITIDNNRFIEKENLADLEKMARLHYELGVNVEGLDVIRNLLQKMNEMEYEIKTLRNRFSGV